MASILFSAILISPILVFDVSAQSPPTNLNVMRTLAQNIGQKVSETIQGSDAETLRVLVLPRETAWYVEAFLLNGLSEANRHIVVAGAADVSIEFGVSSLRVVYDNARTEGILGSRIVDRRVSVDISTRIIDERSQEVVLTREFSEFRKDTVELAAVKDIENPNLPVTLGTMPDEGFFSGLLEPVIVVGTIAVAILLLFSVRS